TQVVIEGLRHFILVKQWTRQASQETSASRHGSARHRREQPYTWRPSRHHPGPRLSQRAHLSARWRHACVLETRLLTTLMKLDMLQPGNDRECASSAKRRSSNEVGLLMLLQDQAVGGFLACTPHHGKPLLHVCSEEMSDLIDQLTGAHQICTLWSQSCLVLGDRLSGDSWGQN
ncbi:hypothetical protein CSUI_004470, partial [Cystoisospora suis]